MAIQPYQEESEVTNPVKRIRWATHRATGVKADHKRHSLKERLHKRIGSGEKKRDSLGKEAGTIGHSDVESSLGDHEDPDGGRRVYFNVPLPSSERDADGHPKATYARNKIRTAKYTPLSFIPKNLYFQFHNIANMYFLFIIILGVCRLPGALVMCTDRYCVDIPDFWRLEPCSQFGPPNRHSCRDCSQRRDRGLEKDSAGQRIEQCAGAQTGGLQ